MDHKNSPATSSARTVEIINYGKVLLKNPPIRATSLNPKKEPNQMKAKLINHLIKTTIAALCIASCFLPVNARAALELWNERYNAVPGSPQAGRRDMGTQVKWDADGNVLIVALVAPTVGEGHGDYYIAKYAGSTGDVIWSRTINRLNDDSISEFNPPSLAVDADGNAIVAGHFHNYGGPGTDDDYYTVKLAANDGTILWQQVRHLGSNFERLCGVAVDAAGNVVVAGTQAYSAKYAGDTGAVIWEQRHLLPGGAAAQAAKAMGLDAAGNVYVAGSNPNGNRWSVLKRNGSDGTLAWANEGPLGDGNLECIAVSGAGDCFVGGRVGYLFFTAKLNGADGTVAWSRSKAVGEDPASSARCIALGTNGTVAAGGSLGYSFYASLQDAATGNVTWETTPVVDLVSARGIAVDGQGNVVTAGIGYFGNGGGKFFVLKYTAAGIPLWSYIRSGNTSEQAANALAVASTGMIAATGMVSNSDPDWDVFTAVLNPVENPPTIAVDRPSSVTGTGATLGSIVNPQGSDSTVYFEYGTSTAYGSQSTPQNIGSGGVPVNVQAAITGLASGTVYHFRTVVTTSLGPTYGVDRIFATSAAGETVSLMLAVGDAAAGVSNAVFTSFGFPAMNESGALAFTAKIKGTTSAANTALGLGKAGIWVRSAGGSDTLIIRTGDTAPGTAAGIFSSVGDPIFNNGGSVAFNGKLKAGVGDTLGTNDMGVWSNSGGSLALTAREGDNAPGCPSGAVFSAFTQIALPDQGGVVMFAKLRPNPGVVTSANDTGIWAVDTGGTLRLIAREGDLHPVAGKNIVALSFLPTVAMASGQTRSYAQGTGDIVYRASFTDGSSGIFKVTFP